MRKGSTGNKYKKRRKMSYVNNGVITTRIPEEEVEEFLMSNPSYSRGAVKVGRVIVTNGTRNRYLSPDKVLEFLQDNPDYYEGHVNLSSRITINNGIVEKHVKESELEGYLLEGFKEGRLITHWVPINNGVVQKKIPKGSLVPDGWSVGWIPGKNHSIHSRISISLFDALRESLPDLEMRYGDSGEYRLSTGILYHDLNCESRYLDFYSQSVNKCIEFHGDYWHRRTGGLLGESYDRIKSDYNKFKAIRSHGIDVIYIWEEDFNRNSEDTINKCVKFLSDPNDHGVISIDDWSDSNKISRLDRDLLDDLLEIDDLDYYEYNQMRRDLWMESQGKVG